MIETWEGLTFGSPLFCFFKFAALPLAMGCRPPLRCSACNRASEPQSAANC